MRRGEIWWAQMLPPIGRRPVLILSRDEACDVRLMITVAPITSQIRHVATEVPLSRRDGMPRACVINLDNLTTIPKVDLRERITHLSAAKLRDAEVAIRFALGMED